MSEKSIEDELRGYYENESLSEQKVAAILDTSSYIVSAQRWKRIAIGMGLALAAVSMFAITLVLDRPGKPADPSPIASEVKTPREPKVESVQGRSIDTLLPEQKTESYRLVAFRSHGNACPHCRATSEVFVDVRSRLNDQTLDFEIFDLSKSNELAETTKRVNELHLTSMIAGRIETAFLAIVDSNGKSIQEFKPSMSSQRIEKAIRSVVTK